MAYVKASEVAKKYGIRTQKMSEAIKKGLLDGKKESVWYINEDITKEQIEEALEKVKKMPKEVRVIAKKENPVVDAMIELSEYNRKNGTNYSYGVAVMKGII